MIEIIKNVWLIVNLSFICWVTIMILVHKNYLKFVCQNIIKPVTNYFAVFNDNNNKLTQIGCSRV